MNVFESAHLSEYIEMQTRMRACWIGQHSCLASMSQVHCFADIE